MLLYITHVRNLRNGCYASVVYLFDKCISFYCQLYMAETPALMVHYFVQQSQMHTRLQVCFRLQRKLIVSTLSRPIEYSIKFYTGKSKW